MNWRSGMSMCFVAVVMIACGEKSDYELKSENDAKERAEQNKAAHESRNQ